MRFQSLYCFVLIIMLSLFSFTSNQAQNVPQLVSQAFLLYPAQLENYDEDSYTLEFYSKLSRFGRFVVGITTIDKFSESQAFLQVWETNRSEITSSLKQLQPHISYDLGFDPEDPILFLSPDEKYAAVLIGKKLRIFNLPSLDPYLIEFIDNLEVQDVAWSTSGDLMGMLTDTDLVVYNVSTHESYLQPVPQNFDPSFSSSRKLRRMETGWLYSDWNDQVFTVCQYQLEMCQTYFLQEKWDLIPKLDGSQIIGFDGNSLETKTSKVWNLESGTDYQISNLAFRGFESGLGEFSPTGRYITGYQYLALNEGMSRVIYEFDNLEQVFIDRAATERSIFPPAWFPNDDFFLVLSFDLLLKLYRVNQQIPLQVLDLNSIDTEAVLKEPIKFRAEDTLNVQLDKEGDQALVNFSYSAILLQILYE